MRMLLSLVIPYPKHSRRTERHRTVQPDVQIDFSVTFCIGVLVKRDEDKVAEYVKKSTSAGTGQRVGPFSC